MKINPTLIWDYELSATDWRRESVKRWYIARVLIRGTVQDIRAIGVGTIQRYLPRLSLPARIREFWEWYFTRPFLRRH